MKDIRSFILEKKAVNFGSAKSNYGQCVILAGGPGSGKGFIKDNKILGSFKSVDVDEMKKMYIKLQNAGKIDDKYNYDFCPIPLVHYNKYSHPNQVYQTLLLFSHL